MKELRDASFQTQKMFVLNMNWQNSDGNSPKGITSFILTLVPLKQALDTISTFCSGPIFILLYLILFYLKAVPTIGLFGGHFVFCNHAY